MAISAGTGRRQAAQRRLWLALLFLVLALLALLAAGALKARRDFLTRGMPDGLPEPIPYGGARPGLNVYLNQYDDEELATALERIAGTGVDAVKQPFYFQEPFDWEAADRLMDGASDHGLQLVPLLDGDPATGFAPPDDPTSFATWAGAFAERYGDRLTHYIIWDEPNLASHWGGKPANPAAYAALLTAAAEAIRAADGSAVIVAAPLAPTRESGPDNLADPLFLQELYEAGAGDAFDVAAGKPYGFDSGPEDRVVDVDVLNFSRIILLREVLVRNGDGHKAVWAGNWGWNSLPAGWQGSPSIWGQTTPETQAARTVEAIRRAQREWPWMGFMFLENWEAPGPAGDPRWGFSIAGRPAEEALATAAKMEAEIAYPGFHLAQETGVGQRYEGEWRFSPAFGADIPRDANVETGNATATVRFWGTDVGLRVRHADFRARLYVTVDGEPAGALPQDENGPALVLTAADPSEDYLETEVVARNLEAGEHTLQLIAHRGWEQWALNGYSVAYHRPTTAYWIGVLGLVVLAVGALVIAARNAVAARPAWARLGQDAGKRLQPALTIVVAAVVALSGWLTWGEQAAGIYRRLGEGGQLALTAAAASIFYFTPFFVVYVAALIALFFCVYARPAWGVALVAFTIPFYVKPKPMLGYRFSPVEVFLLVTVVAWAVRRVGRFGQRLRQQGALAAPVDVGALVARFRDRLVTADYAVATFVAVATLSLFFTERLDVAVNEWRVVILEPTLFYALLRTVNLKEKAMHRVLDAFVLGGIVIALYGLATYRPEGNVITVTGGLLRLKSIFGSPNNVALYLGRVLPLLAAVALMGRAMPRRRLAYGLAMAPVGLAVALTLSKGALFLGLPAAFLLLFIVWQREGSRPVWPWLAGAAVVAAAALGAALSVPALASRLDLGSATSVFRINLWQASVNMFSDHPVFGVGLDNFLYAYRGRYIFDAAWQEPDLNHPHNVILDFATRLGMLGLVAGGWLFWSLGRLLRRLPGRVSEVWRPVAIGLAAAFANMLAHGLVDHSFFLVDLSFAFYLMLGVAVWLAQGERGR